MIVPRETFGGKFTLVTPPASEPISLAEAKSHLRVDITDDDALITTLITAARLRCESELDRSFVNTSWNYTLERFPFVTTDRAASYWVPNVIAIPKCPLASVTSVSYTAVDGTTATLVQGTDYLVHTAGEPGAVQPFPLTRIWPLTRTQLGAVTIRAVVGYGIDAPYLRVVE